MAKTLSYINTSSRTRTGVGASIVGKSSSHPSIGPSAGLTITEILNRILPEVTDLFIPAISENYADLVTQLMSSSYLYNPAFADGADGWTITEEDLMEQKVLIVSSDYKNRLCLSGSGSILQANERIVKPKRHKEYTFTETDGDGTLNPDGEGSPSDTFVPSEDLVTDPVEWSEIKDPVMTEGEKEKRDVLHLSLKYVCKKSGTINVGFVGSDLLSEGSLPICTVQMTESEEIQEIESEGTWDGNGDFKIWLTSGEVEIVSLSLLGNPLEEYRKENDSHVKQTIENFQKLLVLSREMLHRVELIQGHINQLYGNDSIFKEKTEDLEKRMEPVEKALESNTKRIESVEKTLLQHETGINNAISSAESSLAASSQNSREISSLNGSMETLYSRLVSLGNSISTLEGRVSALESSSPPAG